MRRKIALVALAVLGASCTGDRPASRTPEPSAREALPVCRMSPGPPPGGFLLARTRELRYRDHVGVREEYRHADGRLLVYLLGVTGEMGEGAPVAEEVELASGQPAHLFGSPENDSWSLVWEGERPCSQVAVVGNGFTRTAFTAALREMTVIP